MNVKKEIVSIYLKIATDFKAIFKKMVYSPLLNKWGGEITPQEAFALINDGWVLEKPTPPSYISEKTIRRKLSSGDISPIYVYFNKQGNHKFI